MSILSVIIPVYHNQDSLIPLVEELVRVETALMERHVQLQLIFVNDGSRDASMERLHEIQRRRPATIVINHLANRGSMSAIRTGLNHATGDCFTYLAADLQDPPHLLVEMVDAWLSGNRFVVCTRAKRDDPWITSFMAMIHYRLVRLLVAKDYPIGGFDVALMDRIMVPHLLQCGPNKNLSLFAWSLGIPPKILTYHRLARVYGRSMWTLHKKVNYFIDTMVGFSVKPLRLMTAFGFFLSIGCFVYVSFVIVCKILGLIDIRGYTTMVALFGFLQGCGFMMMGALGEYVWRIYKEINGHSGVVYEVITPPVK